MTSLRFNRVSDFVRARQARDFRITKDARTKAPVDPAQKKRHQSPDPDKDRIALKVTQNRLLKKTKVKPSMPRMPWEEN